MSIDKKLFEEAKALAEENPTFQLKTSFLNWRNKALGLEPRYHHLHEDFEKTPRKISKKDFVVGDNYKMVTAGDYEAQEEFLKTNNDMKELYKEAGFDIATPEKFMAFQKELLASDEPQKMIVNMQQKVQDTLDAKTPEQLAGKSYLSPMEPLAVGFDAKFFEATIGDKATKRYNGALCDYDAYTPEERADMVQNGQYFELRPERFRPGHTAFRLGSKSDKFFKQEGALLKKSMNRAQAKTNSKMVASIVVLFSAGLMYSKKMEWAYRDSVAQQLTFKERISSLESDYFPTEESIHAHFRLKEWYYRQFKTWYGEEEEEEF